MTGLLAAIWEFLRIPSSSQRPLPRPVHLYGENGTGKTFTAKFVLEHVEKWKDEILDFRVVYLNLCLVQEPSIKLVIQDAWRRVATQLDLECDWWNGTAVQTALEKYELHVILLVDDLDCLLKAATRSEDIQRVMQFVGALFNSVTFGCLPIMLTDEATIVKDRCDLANTGLHSRADEAIQIEFNTYTANELQAILLSQNTSYLVTPNGEQEFLSHSDTWDPQATMSLATKVYALFVFWCDFVYRLLGFGVMPEGQLT